VDLSFPDDVALFGRSAAAALTDSNLDRTRRAQDGDGAAVQEVLDALGQVGIDQLGLDEPDSCLAAGELARQVGRIGSPVPIAALLTAQLLGHRGAVHAVGDERQALIDHADPDTAPLAVSPDGAIRPLHPLEANDPKRLLAPFASVCDVGEPTSTDARAWPLHEILSAFTSLGTLEQAMELSTGHLREREQFGRTLASFQAMQHRLADVAVLVAGLRELALYTATRWTAAADSSLAEALVLRLQHLDVVQQVFRHAHQIHGAIGFCDEHPLAVLAKSVRVRQYVPLTVDATALLLVDHLDEIDLPFPLTTGSKATR
jgi:alkylation response protein AidB-like acyl-CoA dehydrogenase